MDNENNVRILDFSRETQVMPEDIFEGDAPSGWTEEEIAAAEAQFTEEATGQGTIVTGDFGPSVAPAPLTAVSLHKSDVFFYIEIPSLGVEVPLDVPTALSLFDELGAAINGL